MLIANGKIPFLYKETGLVLFFEHWGMCILGDFRRKLPLAFNCAAYLWLISSKGWPEVFSLCGECPLRKKNGTKHIKETFLSSWQDIISISNHTT